MDLTTPIAAYKTEKQRDWHMIRATTEDMIAAAIANGTHSERTLCSKCRRWVNAITWVGPDQSRLCRDCDPTRTV
jgi:hypothetical protein